MGGSPKSNHRTVLLGRMLKNRVKRLKAIVKEQEDMIKELVEYVAKQDMEFEKKIDKNLLHQLYDYDILEATTESEEDDNSINEDTNWFK